MRSASGAFTLVAVDSQAPDTVVAARRNPLVVGVGEGENFVASDVAAFIEHTREAIELGQDSWSASLSESVKVITFDGEPAVVKPYHVLGPVRGREGRLRLVHAEGDLRATPRGSRHAARPP